MFKSYGRQKKGEKAPTSTAREVTYQVDDTAKYTDAKKDGLRLEVNEAILDVL